MRLFHKTSSSNNYNNVPMKRDIQLDLYRALSMIYVICVTHILFWLNIGSEPILSIILIEMPVFFFISGAVLSLKENHHQLLETILNRLKRVVIPYYIYSLVTIGIIAILTVYCLYFQPQFESIYGLKLSCNKIDICSYNWTDFLNILLCNDIPQAPFAMHLWFILPYFILSSTFCIQIKLTKKINRWIYTLFSIILFLLIQAITTNILLNNIFCYNIFIIIGYLFYKNINNYYIYLIGGISFGILAIYATTGGWITPMQYHKFPPDYVFLLYNIFTLCFLSILFSKLSIPNLKILQLWNVRGYTIYLYQNIIFFLIYPVYLLQISRIPYKTVQWGICAIIMFIASTITSYFAYSLEKWVMCKLKILKHND